MHVHALTHRLHFYVTPLPDVTPDEGGRLLGTEMADWPTNPILT